MPVNLERDAGFCSGSSDNGDDFPREDPSSPTDASEDSIEVKLNPIVIPKNKRKSLEPSKVVADIDFPLKKRIKYEDKLIAMVKTEPVEQNPFRPWASVSESEFAQSSMPNPAEVYLRHPGVTTLHRVPDIVPSTVPSTSNSIQEQPLALLNKRPSVFLKSNCSSPTADRSIPFSTSSFHIQPQHHESETSFMDMSSSSDNLPILTNTNSSDSFGSLKPNQHRNYKNMTRERRIEANARERTRVHTISAAFDTLRKSIPSYSQSQKLSKLSVLRVACSYILTLSRIAGDDYSPDLSEPSIGECTDEVSRTIQTEGKIRKKKDE